MPKPGHGDEFEVEEEGAEDEKADKRKRIDLSMSQVAGAGMATLTAATAASYLNVYGTVIGTAVMAVLSTSAAPVIQHWITRSSEQAKELAEKGGKQPGAKALVDPGSNAAAESRAAKPVLGPDTTRVADTDGYTDPYGFPAGGDDDATRTMAMPVVGRDLPGQTVAHGFGNPEGPTVVGGSAVPEATEVMPKAGGENGSRPPGGGPGRFDGPDDPKGDADGEAERPKRGWRTAALSAAAVFTLVMLVILAFELLTGRSLTAWTQGEEGHTSPSLLGGNSAPAEVEEEDPETTQDEQPESETDTGTREPQEPEEPVEPEPGTTPGEQQPDGPADPNDPVDPPVDEGTPEEPGGGEDADPGPGGGGEGDNAPPEADPEPVE